MITTLLICWKAIGIMISGIAGITIFVKLIYDVVNDKKYAKILLYIFLVLVMIFLLVSIYLNISSELGCI